MSAKNAQLERTGSHYLSDDGSHGDDANGISREEVYVYLSATWRGKPVRVTMSCDRYCASFDGENRLTDWRVYARDVRYYDPEKNGGRGEEASGTARSALSTLCEPIATEWLDSEEYRLSYQVAAGHMIMRHFRDDYSAERRVSEALERLGSHLAPMVRAAITETLDAYRAFQVAKAHAEHTLSN